MREILFRGMNENAEWIEGCLITAPNYTCILQDEDAVHPMDYPYLDGEMGTFDGKATPVNPETVCQFTGLTDKNGVKIFEGDIVEGLFLFGMSINAVATFKDGSFGLKWYRGSIEEFSAFSCFHNVTFEVIGNIFDNSELMEGGVEND